MKRLTLSALVAIASSLAASAGLAQDVAAGKTSFNKCMACHAGGEGAKNKVGPELNGLDGRHSGTAASYSYSDANKNSGITWNEAQFKDYIKDKAKIPGTNMVFAGIKNEKEGSWRPLVVSRAIRQGRKDQVRAPSDASLANQRSSILRPAERTSFGIIERDAGRTS